MGDAGSKRRERRKLILDTMLHDSLGQGSGLQLTLEPNADDVRNANLHVIGDSVQEIYRTE